MVGAINTNQRRIRILTINAANLHAGGGIQVAASFINEIPASYRSAISIFASSEVTANIRLSQEEILQFAQFKKINIKGFFRKNKSIANFLNTSKSVFTVFGPSYNWKHNYRSIVGFAQPWIIYPNNECYGHLSFLMRLKNRLKYWIQGFYFKRADVLIVELEHVRERLISELKIKPDRIVVIHNCLSSIYFDEKNWERVFIPPVDCDIRLGYLGRNYLHKNTAIFPAIASELKRKYGISVRFYVTFTENEWKKCTSDFKAISVNVGSLTVAQCPSFYKAVDAIVFPSLLECFSATPLETMAMGKPLFASDRPFNRDICGKYANYFDPTSPESAAEVIAHFFSTERQNRSILCAARNHAINFSNAKDRAKKYLDLLMQRD